MVAKRRVSKVGASIWTKEPWGDQRSPKASGDEPDAEERTTDSLAMDLPDTRQGQMRKAILHRWRDNNHWLMHASNISAYA